MKSQSYKSSSENTRRNAAFQKRQTQLHGRVDARAMRPATPIRFGALANREYVGCRGFKNGHPI